MGGCFSYIDGVRKTLPVKARLKSRDATTSLSIVWQFFHAEAAPRVGPV